MGQNVENKRPLFLEAKKVGGSTYLFLMPNQNTKVASPEGGGKELKLTKEVTVISRPDHPMVEGEIHATDSISAREEGSDTYITGKKTIRLIGKPESKEIPLSEEDTALKDAWTTIYNERYRRSETKKETRNGKKTFLSMLMDNSALKPPTLEQDGFYVEDDLWYFLVRCASLDRGKQIMLTGDSGNGKTSVVDLLCKKLGKTLNIYDMAISNPQTALCGNHRINSKGVSEFQYARFATNIQQPGIQLLDEISRAAPSANNVLLPVTDDRRTLYIESAMEETQIKLHPDCIMWATANIGIEYIGTNAVDNALMNRFMAVEVKAPPAESMIRLLQVREKLDAKEAKMLVEVWERINSEKLSKGISPRQLLEVASLLHDGWGIADSFKFAVLSQYEYDEADGGEQGTVKTILQSY